MLFSERAALVLLFVCLKCESSDTTQGTSLFKEIDFNL